MEHEFGYYVNIEPHRMWNSKTILLCCVTSLEYFLIQSNKSNSDIHIRLV